MFYMHDTDVTGTWFVIRWDKRFELFTCLTLYKQVIL